MGRRPPITEKLITLICMELEKGTTVKATMAKVGMVPATFYKWIRRGEREMRRMEEHEEETPHKDEALYVLFVESTTRARGLGQAKFEEAILKAAVGDEERNRPPDWRASLAWLEKSPASSWNAQARERNKVGNATYANLAAGGIVAEELTAQEKRWFARRLATDEKAMDAAVYLQSIVDEVKARTAAAEEGEGGLT